MNEHDLIPPWLFFGSGTERDCRAYFTIFLHTGIVPQRCKHYCYKVVISVDCLTELKRLKDFLASQDFLSKCGVDRRPYTTYCHVGFIYCDDANEAERKATYVKRRFAEWEVEIVRGCTEMRSSLDHETALDVNLRQGYSVYQSQNLRKMIEDSWV